MTKIEWLKPKKSDKGAIVLYLNGPYNLLLWTKKNLDDWMLMIEESVQRNKIRRSFILHANGASFNKTKQNGQSVPTTSTSKSESNIPTQLQTAQSPADKQIIIEDDGRLAQTNEELYENTANDRETNNLAETNRLVLKELGDNNGALLSNDPVIKSQTITKYSRNCDTDIANRSLPHDERSPVTPNKQR